MKRESLLFWITERAKIRYSAEKKKKKKILAVVGAVENSITTLTGTPLMCYTDQNVAFCHGNLPVQNPLLPIQMDPKAAVIHILNALQQRLL